MIAGLGVAALVLAACGGGSGAGDDRGDRAMLSGTAASTVVERDRPLTVGLWGDTPYTPQDVARLPAMLERMNAAGLDFSVFDGDFKGGGRCDDGVYAAAVERFDSLDAPAVYVPGDNDWTDCRGDFASVERLAHLRRVMFPRPQSFGRRTMALERQSAEYPENTRWQASGVVFVGVHAVGSNDNKADEAEYRARSAAGRAWLHDSFELAARTGAAGVMVVIQADPYFELVAPAERAAKGVDALDPFVDALRDETLRFRRPVALVHGDSHRFRLDRPLLDRDGKPVANLVRCETFGTPVVSWVRATVDRGDPKVFRFEPQPPA